MDVARFAKPTPFNMYNISIYWNICIHICIPKLQLIKSRAFFPSTETVANGCWSSPGDQEDQERRMIWYIIYMYLYIVHIVIMRDPYWWSLDNDPWAYCTTVEVTFSTFTTHSILASSLYVAHCWVCGLSYGLHNERWS